MARIFGDSLHVAYGQAYVLAGQHKTPTWFENFRGQINGLCGAADPGALFLKTSLHTGQVGFTADMFDTPPPLDDIWEEIVEASFFLQQTANNDVRLVEWGGTNVYLLPIAPGTYRVRYCARGMDLAHDRTAFDPIDFYSLAFWPAEPAGDSILKQTSKTAAYWHEQARNCQSLPPQLRPEQQPWSQWKPTPGKK